MERVIIVGAGLSGATMARLYAESGKDVIVIDKRENIGGNAYDFTDKNGIIVQPFGPHIFHTEDKKVFDFLSRFTTWREYEHRVLAKVRKDKFVPVPFNLTSLFTLYSPDKAEKIKKILIEQIGFDKKVPIMQLKKHENADVRKFAEFVYKNIFYIYSLKQWGIKPEYLSGEIMNRVPVYLSYEDRYFTDKYQYMPEYGFTEMVANMLRHPQIKLKLRTDAKSQLTFDNGDIYFGGKLFTGKVIYTGCIDELFDYEYGELPYRSIKFKFKLVKTPSYQPSAVVNYTTSHNYTRITEFTKFTSPKKENTVIVKEYPKAFKRGRDIPYYPIPMEKNKAHYEKYKKLANRYENLYLLGRLARYEYINMDVAVRKAMDLFEKIEQE